MLRDRSRFAPFLAGLAAVSVVACQGPPWPGRGELRFELPGPSDASYPAVLYLEPEAGGEAETPPAPLVEVASEGASFLPALSAVPVGGRLRFVNRGAVAHRVFTADGGGRLERFVPPRGRSKPLRMPRAGEHRFYCSLHPDESFVVFASPSARFVVLDGEAAPRIREIPVGRYRVRAWSDAGTQELGSVEIRPDVVAVFPVAASPRP